MPTSTIRPVQPADFEQWQPLWDGYQAFYARTAGEAVTRTTWGRFLDPAEPVHALVAERDGRLVGLAHFIFHRNTWMVEPVCYLQDLFTAPGARGGGVGRALVEAVYAAAGEAGASRVYWLTHESNAAAMALYDRLAERSGFVQYRRQLG